MKDRRSVDDLSINELERVLAEKKRAAREARLAKYRQTGRAVHVPVGELPDARLEATGPSASAPRSLARRFFDVFLLLVEVGAVVGLIYVLYNGSNILSQLNQEVAQAIAQSVPTLTPTPLITAVVLPSGHTPPTSPNGPQPNEAEIPASLRPLLQSLPPPVIPTQGPMQALRVVIPAINVDAPVAQGDGWEQLKKGVGQHLGTPDPGQTGNLVLSAHNDIYGEIFRRLDQLRPGDEVQLYTAGQVFTYIITGQRIVEPTEVSVMDPTPHPSLTLISCYPYLVDTQRIVVFADLKTQ
ncbi:MAG TPA: class D sortase [Anaerolineales bacterium]|nr:class D sortase [Anaerolineales bacterium]